MSSFDLTTKITAFEIEKRRNEALDAIAVAAVAMKDAIKKTEATRESLSGVSRSENPAVAFFKEIVANGSVAWGELSAAAAKEAAKSSLDKYVWEGIIDASKIETLMDEEGKREMRHSLSLEIPEITAENIMNTICGLLRDSKKIFVRGLVNVFRNLPNDYATNGAFKLGPKIILGRVQSYGRLSYHKRDALSDLDRTFFILDEDRKGNESYSSYASNRLCEQLSAAFSQASDITHNYGENHAVQVEAEYFSVKVFKNGNAHATFLRKDLLDKANRMIAEYYGEVVADETPAARKSGKSKKTKFSNPDLDDNFYPTPGFVAEMAVDLACIEDGMRVCEPSAGDGAISSKIKEQHPEANIQCYEIDPERAAISGAACYDWLQVPQAQTYDRIVMNPPFSNYRWVSHTLHAWEMLKPGGMLVAIMPLSRPPHRLENEWRGMEGFKIDQHLIPAGAFKHSGRGTNIQTKIAVFRKPV